MIIPESKRRRLHLSPDRFVAGVLLAVCVLWLSERFQWLGFNHHKGWTVLIAVALVGVAAIAAVLWWVGALIVAGRFQVGIRSLFVFSLACSIAVSWLAVEWNKARRQDEAFQEIWISRGWAKYDWELDAEGLFATKPEPPGLSWLRDRLGIDFFSVVVFVHMDGTNVTDAEVEHIAGFAQLEELSLFGTQVTDAGVQHLAGLAHLTKLNLAGTLVTDAGLEHLARVTSLKQLILHDTNVTNVGLAHLAGMTHLQSLDLSNTLVTDIGLSQLRRLPLLQVLELKGDQITDACLEQLEALTQLQQLDITFTNISDAGVATLQSALPRCSINQSTWQRVFRTKDR